MLGGCILILLGTAGISPQEYSPTQPQPTEVTSGEVSFETFVASQQQQTQSAFDISWIIILLGIWTIGVGISGKLMPSYCIRHKQKVTTIRV